MLDEEIKLCEILNKTRLRYVGREAILIGPGKNMLEDEVE